MNPERLKSDFLAALPAGIAHASLRLHKDVGQHLEVRQGVVQPPHADRDTGAMVTVHAGGGCGYAATSDLSATGIAAALRQAHDWATFGQPWVVNYDEIDLGHPKGEFRSPVETPWRSVNVATKIERLQKAASAMAAGGDLADSSASLWHARSERWYFTAGGGEVYQDFDRIVPMLRATAFKDGRSQTRTFGHMAFVRQQGMEVLDELGFDQAATRVAEEARQLVDAPNCPTGDMDLVLMPDQMVLQIHESIGHPLELDRILGDERNYAGTTFVTRDMFGSYQYGSELLNVVYDPSADQQSASFAFDDDGRPAEKEYIIRNGILERPLGGTVSQMRAEMSGTANSRADSWRRPAIDRMANLNVEPGDKSFADIIGGVERGVLMRTNTSWSIDDSRNKFQFGCEYGQLIENGELKGVVRNPNYRGISASFWRNLKAVGDQSTFEILGTPYCGKGEPNQAVFVGHASPVCLFADVAVFGGE